jgi:hypothetical protein
MYQNKIQHMRLGPGKHLHGLTLPGGLKGEDFDYFHELVLNQEFARMGYRGYQDGLQGGMVRPISLLSILLCARLSWILSRSSGCVRLLNVLGLPRPTCLLT